MKLITREEMQAMDARAIQKEGIPSLSLMENAGQNIVQLICKRFPKHSHSQISIFCGPGNNGGDGFVIARGLHETGYKVQTYLGVSEENYSGEAQSNLHRLPLTPLPLHNPRFLHFYKEQILKSDLLVDALFGTGLSRVLEGYWVPLIRFLNQTRIPILSVDIPSGLDANSGKKLGACIHAEITATLHLPKKGLILGPDASEAGNIEVLRIGIPESYEQKIKRKDFLITPFAFEKYLKPRPRESHKYKFGHALSIAGSRNKMGAGLMVARAALRSGAGLSTLALPEEAYKKVDEQFAEIMLKPFSSSLQSAKDFFKKEKFKALAIGPGLGTDVKTKDFISSLFPLIAIPTVLDADALNIVSQDLSLLKKIKAPLLLTPHSGEMKRLAGADFPLFEKNPFDYLKKFSQQHQVWVLLKGYRSVLATPKGELWFNSTGNPGIATAGSGDVLTGIVLGLLAQGLNLEKAALAGIWLHGKAGDLIAEKKGEKGILAWDIAEKIPEVLKKLEEQSFTF